MQPKNRFRYLKKISRLISKIIFAYVKKGAYIESNKSEIKYANVNDLENKMRGKYSCLCNCNFYAHILQSSRKD